EDGIRDATVTGVQTCALPISDQQADRLEAAQPVLVLEDDVVEAGIARGLDQRRIRVVVEDADQRVTRLQPVPHRLLHGLPPWVRSEERRVGKDWCARW